LLTEDNFIDDWKKKISEEIATIPAEPKKELSGEDKEEREPENYQGQPGSIITSRADTTDTCLYLYINAREKGRLR
jgi:hypothetical protein